MLDGLGDLPREGPREEDGHQRGEEGGEDDQGDEDIDGRRGALRGGAPALFEQPLLLGDQGVDMLVELEAFGEHLLVEQFGARLGTGIGLPLLNDAVGRLLVRLPGQLDLSGRLPARLAGPLRAQPIHDFRAFPEGRRHLIQEPVLLGQEKGADGGRPPLRHDMKPLRIDQVLGVRGDELVFGRDDRA